MARGRRTDGGSRRRRPGLDEFRRLGAAVARAGHGGVVADVRPARPVRGGRPRLHGGAGDIDESEAIEPVLVRLARRIVPAGRVELIRATGEPACCKKWKVASHSGTFAAMGEDGRSAAGRRRRGIPGALRGGEPRLAARLHLPGPCGRPAIGAGDATATGHGLHPGGLRPRECAAAGGMGIWGGETMGTKVGRTIRRWAMTSRNRTAHERPDVVRDATFLNAVLPFALAQSRRHGEPVSLLCVRLDRLGAIRNLLGPTLADRLVHDLAATVGSLVRASDIVARLDDDRIVALLVRARGDGAMRVARIDRPDRGRVGARIARAARHQRLDRRGRVPDSIARDAASLLDAADEAMVMARAGGSHSPVLAGPRPGAVHSSDYAPAMAVPTALAACPC